MTQRIKPSVLFACALALLSAVSVAAQVQDDPESLRDLPPLGWGQMSFVEFAIGLPKGGVADLPIQRVSLMRFGFSPYAARPFARFGIISALFEEQQVGLDHPHNLRGSVFPLYVTFTPRIRIKTFSGSPLVGRWRGVDFVEIVYDPNVTVKQTMIRSKLDVFLGGSAWAIDGSRVESWSQFSKWYVSAGVEYTLYGLAGHILDAMYILGVRLRAGVQVQRFRAWTGVEEVGYEFYVSIGLANGPTFIGLGAFGEPSIDGEDNI